MDYLESLFDRALDAVVGMDVAGRITAWNGAAERAFGWSREEAIGTLLGGWVRCRIARTRAASSSALNGLTM